MEFYKIDENQLYTFWNTAIVGIRGNNERTGPPNVEDPAVYISTQGGPFQYIGKNILEQYGIIGTAYCSIVEAEGNFLRFPTMVRQEVTKHVTSIRQMLEDFGNAPARSVISRSGNYPIHRRNYIDWDRGVTLRKCFPEIRIFPEDKKTSISREEKVLTYRELFNRYGGTTYTMPPVDMDYRSAEDRLEQMTIFREETLPLVETLTQSSHTVYVKYEESTKRSAHVAVSSRGSVHIVLKSPQNEKDTEKQEVKHLPDTLHRLRTCVDALIRNQREITERAETLSET